MRAITGLFVLTALLGLTGAKKDDDTPRIRWEHPWVAERLFDYGHSSWRPMKDSEFSALYRTNDLLIQHLPDGSRTRRWEFELVVNDPSRMPAFFRIADTAGVTETEVTDFDVRWISNGVTRVFDESELFKKSQSSSSSYISDRAGLSLNLDRRRPGTLKGVVQTIDSPHAGFEGLIAGHEFLQGGAASKSRTITVEVPKGTQLQFETRFFTPSEMPEKEEVGEFDRYRFDFETLLSGRWEKDMPHAFDSYPSLWWSNQASWEDLAALLDTVWEPELEANEAMVAYAEELTAGLEQSADKALAIHDAVADGWDYLGFYPGESGWIPHPATQCFVDRIGDCKDKTALMIAMMRAVGLDAHPTLVNARNAFVLSSAPQPYFNHAIVRVDDPGHPEGGFFLDSTDAGIGAMPVPAWIADRPALVIDDVAG
ncbi:MAG: transglutaminase domain-containing protein, partial [Deltaproteobacteria bacterium]|nr:transglutaminase domain-containing protein [Deltaproteobacteria bacterium]